MINPGQILQTYAFGECVIRRTYKHPDTKEMVADVKVIGGIENGTVLHLSLAYVNKLTGRPQ